MRSLAIVLLMAAAVVARPSPQFGFGGGSFGGQNFFSPAGVATGSAGGTVTSGVSNTPLGSTSITNVGASAGVSTGTRHQASGDTAPGCSGAFGG